jgi:hypothetical protein
VPRTIYPNWKRNITTFLIVKRYASFSVKQKTIIRNRAGGAVTAASMTILATDHHPRFLPTVFDAR